MSTTEHTPRLDHATVEQQITEMWQAMADSGADGSPGYSVAYDQCCKAERDMRDRLKKQDALDLAAPDLLEACKLARAWCCGQLNDSDPESRNVVPSLNHAIAKAEGR